MTETYVAVFHENSIWDALYDPKFGPKFHKAALDLKGRPAKPQPVKTYRGYVVTSWVIGKDASEATQVYVVSGTTGKRVYQDMPAKQSDLDALVDML